MYHVFYKNFTTFTLNEKKGNLMITLKKLDLWIISPYNVYVFYVQVNSQLR